MPTLAHYQVLADNRVLTLPNILTVDEDFLEGESGETRVVRWDPADDILLDGSGENRPLLCFNVDCDNAEDLQLEVSIRNLDSKTRTIQNFEWNGRLTHQVMEPFPSEWVRRESNRISFTMGTGTGGMDIRNVVIFYHRRIK